MLYYWVLSWLWQRASTWSEPWAFFINWVSWNFLPTWMLIVVESLLTTCVQVIYQVLIWCSHLLISSFSTHMLSCALWKTVTFGGHVWCRFKVCIACVLWHHWSLLERRDHQTWHLNAFLDTEAEVMQNSCVILIEPFALWFDLLDSNCY